MAEEETVNLGALEELRLPARRHRIIEYGIIESDESLVELTEAVVNAIREGWTPAGGLAVWTVPAIDGSVLYREASMHYAQALVKYGPAE